MTNPIDVPVPDDSGSETVSRYEFQAMLTAQACLRLLTDDGMVSVICEMHEDYIETFENERPCLVSVKHLEPSVGRWTFATICDDGGIAHLFQRWQAHGEGARCRLRTNGGLATGNDGAAALKNAAETGEDIDAVAARLAKRFGSDAATTRRFVESLEIDAELPKRDDLHAKLTSEVIPDLCGELGWAADEVVERFRAVTDEVWSAMGSDFVADARTAGVAGSDYKAARARTIAKKTITRSSLHEALQRTRVATATRLVQKLERGGLGPTDIERCKRLRADWLKFENDWRPEVARESGLDATRALVQDAAVMAEIATRSEAPYADRMRTVLLDQLRSVPVQVAGRAIDAQLALGAAYDETDRCKIWWSDRFELR